MKSEMKAGPKNFVGAGKSELPANHEIVVGLKYPVGADNIDKARTGNMDAVTEWREAEPGDIVDDIPTVSAGWLLARGAIKVSAKAVSRKVAPLAVVKDSFTTDEVTP